MEPPQHDVVRLNIHAPIPIGHRVEVHTLRLKVLIGHSTIQVVRDLNTGILYCAHPRHAHYLLGQMPYPSGSSHMETLRGEVQACIAATTYGEHGLARTELTLLVEEPDEPTGPQRHRVLNPQHARMLVTDRAFEQQWPNGTHQHILWDEPFQVLAHRNPNNADRPNTDVHIHIQQRRDGASLHVIALTLALETTPTLLNLPAKLELLPRIEGEEATWLITALRYYAEHHGLKLPF